MSIPLENLDRFRTELSSLLADAIGIPLRAVESAVEVVTAEWSIEIHHMRPLTDHHTRYAIHTPWVKAGGE